VAAAAAWVMGVPRESIAQTLALFPGVLHRLEFVAEVGGVRYVNDSKGTNPDASTKALEAYEDPIVLIAGGRNKGNDFDGFGRLIKEKVRVLVVLGESAGQIADAAQKAGFTDILQASDLQSAVRLAHGAAQPGEVVLLSPACASWDMFRSYEERGDLFRRTVLSLARRPADAG
ncbi:MAG: glutamate ligase domain-containing protein, partial [Candidatus Desulforudaceae bacterium]